jgi:hypothetical protein
VKIFVSYSRKDAGDFANQIHMHLSSSKDDIFTDVDSIRAGEIWSNTITTNISNCDIFVIIVTYGALQSPHVENEVLQAQKEKKIIIPCFHRTVIGSDIKWGLDTIQGVEFDEKYELARNIQSKISSSRGKGAIFGSTSKTVEATKIATTTAINSNTERLQQNKLSKERTDAIGGGPPFIPSKIKDYAKTSKQKTTSNANHIYQKKGTSLKKIIIILIIVVAILALIVFINNNNTVPSILEQNPLFPFDTEQTTNPLFPFDTEQTTNPLFPSDGP